MNSFQSIAISRNTSLAIVAPGIAEALFATALGLLTADFRHDYVRTVLWTEKQATLKHLLQVINEMKGLALTQMENEGLNGSEIIFVAGLDMRYQGQGFSLPVSFNVEDLSIWENLSPLIRTFNQNHQSTYGYHDEKTITVIVNIRLASVGKLPKPHPTKFRQKQGDLNSSIKESRKVYFSGRFEETIVYDRSKLGWGAIVKGPAIIEQLDSTTLIMPGQQGEIEKLNNLIISLEDI